VICFAESNSIGIMPHEHLTIQCLGTSKNFYAVHASFLESDTSQCLISNAMRSSFCAAGTFSFSAAPTQAPQKFEDFSESRTLFPGDRPRLVPRSLSWKKSSALWRVWHKPERMLEASFLCISRNKGIKNNGKVVPPSQFIYRWSKSSIACLCNCTIHLTVRLRREQTNICFG